MYSLNFFSRSNDRVKETFNQYNRSRYLKLLSIPIHRTYCILRGLSLRQYLLSLSYNTFAVFITIQKPYLAEMAGCLNGQRYSVTNRLVET